MGDVNHVFLERGGNDHLALPVRAQVRQVFGRPRSCETAGEKTYHMTRILDTACN